MTLIGCYPIGGKPICIVAVLFNLMGRRTKEYADKDVAATMQKVGERLRQLRIAKGYTSQETFAYEKNINRVQYARYERGEDIRLSTLISVLGALGVSLQDFFGEFRTP